MNIMMRDTILLVEDSASSRALLRGIFEDNYNILEAENGEQALSLLRQNRHTIAAVLLDIVMSVKDGFEVLSEMRRSKSLQTIPVIVITAYEDTDREVRALKLGARDIIIKPFSPEVVRHRVHNIVELSRHKWHLEDLVAEQGNVLRHSNEVMVDALSSIIEHRNLESGQHVMRIRGFTRILLQAVADRCPEYNLDDQTINTIASASTLHDIGKISIPDAILNKPGRLTEEEFRVMKTHTVAGSNMLESLRGMGDQEYLYFAHNICRYHHERWDGKGYPDGLVGDEIPLCAQVVGVADVYDALTTSRVYKPAFPHEEAVRMIMDGECGMFSPQLLECFQSVASDFAVLAISYAEGAMPRMATETHSSDMPFSNVLESAQMTQLKYQTILRHLNSTVVEIDPDRGLYQVVYNPDPHLPLPTEGSSLMDLFRAVSFHHVHPEDFALVKEVNQFVRDDFFRQGIRKYSFHYRMTNFAQENSRAYEVTILRLDPTKSSHRRVIAIWRPTGAWKPSSAASRQPTDRIPEVLLRDLEERFLRIRNDEGLTVLEGKHILSRLTGYSKAELSERFHNKLMEMVIPEDQEFMISQASEQLIRGGAVDMEFRLQQKNGRTLWVFCHSRLVSDAEGVDHFCCILTDNSKSRSAQVEILSLLERNQAILEQSDDIIFELNLVDDTLICSPKWNKLFGYPPITRDFCKTVSRANHFHPDDLSALTAKLEKIREGSLRHMEEIVRITTAEGRYLWCRIRATVLRDIDGKPTRVTGVIANIDEERRSLQLLQEQVEKDSLTHLLNKTTTRQQVEETLAACPANGRSTLLIADLDHFKQINDRYGHMFGDTVLAQVATEIRRIFHGKDIIGRLGGDEFLIFMQDIPSTKLVETRCAQLNAAIRRLFRELASDYRLSCSIGVALYPEHGTSYQDLFQCADQALYEARSRGRNCHVLYQPGLTAFQTGPTHITGTHIDSDNKVGMTNNDIIHFVFRRLYEEQDMDTAINSILALVGTQLNVSRVYVIENNADNTKSSNTYEWCNVGISPQIQNLQDVSYVTDVPGWEKQYDERGVFYCPDISRLSEEQRAILEPQGVRSMLHCAIREHGVFRGFIGFDECTSNWLWTKDQVELLIFLSQILAMFLLKKRAQDETAKYSTNLRGMLDSQEHAIYVVDKEYRIRFSNANCAALTPDLEVGDTCYRSIMRVDHPCENCPIRNLRSNDFQCSIVKSPCIGLRVESAATPVTWDGEDAYMVTCHKLSPALGREGAPQFAEQDV